MKKVQILDLLGLKIPDRNLLLNDVCGKYLNILECNAVYFNHIYSDQSDCLARNVFHFKRHLHKVRKALNSSLHTPAHRLKPSNSNSICQIMPSNFGTQRVMEDHRV